MAQMRHDWAFDEMYSMLQAIVLHYARREGSVDRHRGVVCLILCEASRICFQIGLDGQIVELCCRFATERQEDLKMQELELRSTECW